MPDEKQQSGSGSWFGFRRGGRRWQPGDPTGLEGIGETVDQLRSGTFETPKPSLPDVNMDRLKSLLMGEPGQQTLLERGLGIERGSTLDMPSFSDLLRSGADKWRTLSKAPQPAAPAAPAAPSQAAAPAAPPAVPPFTPSLGQPFAASQARTPAPPGQFDVAARVPGTMVRGRASFPAGPSALSTSGPLAGLKAASSQFERPYRSTEELYRQAFASPDTVAPGASQYASSQLAERGETDAFERLLGMKRREAVSGAQTSLHPDVQASEELTARRKAYPQQAYAEGLGEQAEVAAEASLQKAIIDAQQGNLDSMRDLLGPLANAFADIVTGPDEDMAADAYSILLDILKRSSGAGAF